MPDGSLAPDPHRDRTSRSDLRRPSRRTLVAPTTAARSAWPIGGVPVASSAARGTRQRRPARSRTWRRRRAEVRRATGSVEMDLPSCCGERDFPLNQPRFSQRSPYVAFDPVEVRHLPQILTELLIPTARVVVDALLELLGERGGVQSAMCRLLAK